MARFRHILCLVDPTSTNTSALARAVSIAQAHGGRLTVADTVPRAVAEVQSAPDGLTVAQWRMQLLEERERLLAAVTEPYRDRAPMAKRLLIGTPFLEVIRAVLADGYDLVIKAAENPPLLKRLFGSNDMHLLRKCPCPVWLARATDPDRYRHVLAAIDLSIDLADPVIEQLNARILDSAATVAISEHAKLHVVHAWEAPGELTLKAWSDRPDAATRYVDAENRRHQTAMETVRAAFRQRLGEAAYDRLAPTFHLERGPATVVIPAAGERLGIDLMVMGTVARVGIAGLLIGNTAETILDQLDCAVLAIKPPGFESPVRPAA
jgi:universal stress protein E